MKKSKSYSIVRALSGLMILIMAILVINTILSLNSVKQIRDNNIRTISDTLTEYGNQEDSRFASARHFVEWTATKDPILDDMRDESAGEYRKDFLSLRSRLNDMRFSLGNNFMFFMNFDTENAESLQAISSINIPYDEYIQMRRSLIAVSVPRANLLRWNTFSTKNMTYLYYCINYKNVNMYSVLPIDDAMSGLDNLITGKNGYISFLLNGNTEILHANGRGGSGLPFFYRTFSYNSSRDGIPYTIEIRADVYSSYGEQLIRQLMIIVILLLAVIISIVYIARLYRVILMPIENFNAQLSAVSDEDDFINPAPIQITEFSAANDKFRELTDEIKRLRIGMYEKELERRKAQITFLQHQIRPHFYLNCLSTIDSMAQLDDTRGVSDMVRFTSTYMRYLFQADKDMVRLEYELTHIRAYINIQNLRMGDLFVYDERRDDGELSVMIPPLLLITFVENSVKHAIMPHNERLKIQISITDLENGKEKIEIADSGQGFSEADIRKFTDMVYDPDSIPPASNDGHGIGIPNSIRRLTLMYNSDFSMSFYNGDSPEYPGAHTVLIIPRIVDDIYSDEVKME